MSNITENQIPMVEVCPTNGMRKEEMIKDFYNETEKYKEKGIWPYSKYAAACQPDVCIGDCEKCNAWVLRSEKELYIRENDKFFNRIGYELSNFVAHYLLSLPMMLVGAQVFCRNFVYGFIYSFCFALVWKTFCGYTQTYKEYLGEKYENVRNNNKEG